MTLSIDWWEASNMFTGGFCDLMSTSKTETMSLCITVLLLQSLKIIKQCACTTEQPYTEKLMLVLLQSNI